MLRRRRFGAVEAALPRRLVDQPLDNIHRLGKPRSARDADRRGVAQHRHDVQRDGWDRVDAALQMHILVGLHRARAARHIGADIRHAANPQREETAIRIERQRSLCLVVASLMVRHEALAACRDPFHRAPDATRRPQDQRMLGVGEILRAEPAADIRRDEPHVGGRHAQRAGGRVAVAVDVLAGDMQRVAAVVAS